MNTSLTQRLPFVLLQPGMPLRIEVKGAIYFGPVNQQTSETILPRIELGLKVAAQFDGYWIRDAQGRVRRIASLENGSAVMLDGAYIEVYINLRGMGFDEVRALHHTPDWTRLTPEQQVSP